MSVIRLALAQINFAVGDIVGNATKIKKTINKAISAEADIIAFPEMAITGYPPEDLLLKPSFIQDNIDTMHKLVSTSKNLISIIGFVHQSKDLFNAALIAYQNKLINIYKKQHLPNYGVFDEARYFKKGNENLVFQYSDINFSVNICEDIWHPNGPIKKQSEQGANIIININASPYHIRKNVFREKMIAEKAINNNVWIAYLNSVGGQDELVFDGGSFLIDPKGNIVARSKQFKEDLLLIDLPKNEILNKSSNRSSQKNSLIIIDKKLSPKKKSNLNKIAKHLDPLNEIYNALVLGTKDYIKKIKFNKVVIGLSGGIDSSLTATIAVDALGKDNVIGISMASRFTSNNSKTDAKELADNLGIKFWEIPIETLHKAFLEILNPFFEKLPPNSTEENLQARIRGILLMAISNKFGWLVLTTGNKSEMATGYATLYGDMAGGFAVIKDVPKTLVFKLSTWKNSKKIIIPPNIINKPPTAELRENQKDEDSLPKYEILDPILTQYIELDQGINTIIKEGYPSKITKRIAQLVDLNEYKRRQAPPGIKITEKAFGKDRRLPISNQYKPY